MAVLQLVSLGSIASTSTRCIEQSSKVAAAPCWGRRPGIAGGKPSGLEASRQLRRLRRDVSLSAVLGDDRGGGTGILERPGFDRSGTESAPSTESGFGSSDTSRDKKLGGGNYRVMLVDAPQHSEKLVVKVIPVVVPGTTEDHARNCFHTSRQLGQAIVVTALKEHAEFYSEQLYRQGLRSTIEPDTTTL